MKGKFGGNFAPPPPGEELRDLIGQRRHAERPVWRLGPMIAPRIESVAGLDPTTGEPVLDRPLAVDQDRGPYFRPRVLAWLETYGQAALEQLQSHDRAETRRLAAAVMRDLHGQTYEAIADGLRWTDVRTARREVPAGRRLWPRLIAWPWSYWGPEGKPPAGWREQGADPILAAAFETWATGAPVLPPA